MFSKVSPASVLSYLPCKVTIFLSSTFFLFLSKNKDQYIQIHVCMFYAYKYGHTSVGICLHLWMSTEDILPFLHKGGIFNTQLFKWTLS